MSSKVKVAPYGEWSSPITAELVSGSNNSFSEVHVDPTTSTVYLVESRPAESGRAAIVRFDDQKGPADILPFKYNARSSVHDYGGGASTIGHDGKLIFTDFTTKGVFRLNSRDDIQPILEGKEDTRYADFDVHPKEARWLLAVQEVHTAGAVDNKVAVIDADAKESTVICEGADFYSYPRFSHDGKWVCWIQRKHPDMPWTGGELYIAAWDDGKIGQAKFIAGKAGKESVAQPKWHTNGRLLFTSDRTGFHQLYMYDIPSAEVAKVDVEGFEDADLGGPDMFLLGSSTYIELDSTTLVITYTRSATNGMIILDTPTGKVTELPSEIVDVEHSSVRRLTESQWTVVGSTSTLPAALYIVDLGSKAHKTLRSTTSIPVDASIFSRSKSISFPRTYGEDKTGLSHAIFIPPHNPAFTPLPDTKPPLIVYAHGGPTARVTPGLVLSSQYWTSRGYAYVSVNYAGSSGYGRRYIQSLDTFWGIKDVEDTASCIAHLAAQGLVDPERIGIRGQSSGGYTVLQALCTYPRLFTAGTSLYGISNLTNLAAGTHKFESHYLFALMFPEGTPVEEQERVYRERSPCYHAERIESPLLLLQGNLDKIVPLSQALDMEKVLKDGGRDVKLVVFEGEGHGFRKNENLQTAIKEEEALWRRTLLK